LAERQLFQESFPVAGGHGFDRVGEWTFMQGLDDETPSRDNRFTFQAT
jgi:hypothetical protein